MEQENNYLQDYEYINFQPFITHPQYIQYGERAPYNFFYEPPMYPFQAMAEIPMINTFNPIFDMSGSFPMPIPAPIYPCNQYTFGSNLSIPMPGSINAPDLNSLNHCKSTDSKNENTPTDLLKDLNLNIEEDYFPSEDSRNIENQVSSILKKIENNNTPILNTIKAYKVPYPIARLLVRRIVRLTLIYSNNLPYK